MSHLMHAKVNFKAKSGNVKDDCNMSFSFITSAADEEDDLFIAEAVKNDFDDVFLNGANASGFMIADVLGKSLSRTANDVTFSVYGPLTGNQLKGAIKGDASTYMGSPIFEDLMTIGAAGPAEELPRQAALDLVLRASGWEVAPVEAADGTDANAKVDRPKQRLTGRIKVGPIGEPFAVMDANEDSRPTTGLVNTFLQAINAFRDAGLTHGVTSTLAVWSRANQSMIPVTDVQVPNAWSTVIRRKPQVTSRSTTAID